LFDVRPGEYAVTALMSVYLMLVLFAYYILKPVSRALFLNNFDIDRLPWLYILIAGIGGVLAFFYTKVAVKSSLRRAVDYATAFCVAMLALFWWLLGIRSAWVIYAFNIWVSLFSVILVSQGWLVAANLFTSREAKRLYGIVGVGSVLGAAFGGQFTAVMVYSLGNNNLVLASAVMVVLSYVAYRLAVSACGRTLGGARAAEQEDFRFKEIVGAVHRFRHLQVIVAIIAITFIVDVMIEYQFSALAKLNYHGRDLTAFLGNFYGLWLNLITFVLQFLLTSFVVSRFGVGGTLQIMPMAIAAASVASLLAPSLAAAGAARLTEASTRYSFNKTGMELLYMPLPLELRNRVKAFMDVFVDRFSRGIGGMLLLVIPHEPRHLSLAVLIFTAVWILLSVVARRQYVVTIRERFERRRLDFEHSRVPVTDPATIRLLEQTARSGEPRAAGYALGLLRDVPRYDIDPLLTVLAGSPHRAIRAEVFDIARQSNTRALAGAALAAIRNSRPGSGDAAREAVLYALTISDAPSDLARDLVEHRNPEVVSATLDALATRPDLARTLIGLEWITAAANDPTPARRALAAQAIGVRGDAGTNLLFRLLEDPEPAVAIQAIRTVGALQNRDYLNPVIRALESVTLRGEAVNVLARFGPKLIGMLEDMLADESQPIAIRRHIPRVLQRIPDQRSVDALMRALPARDLIMRAAILKALNKLRDAAPALDYDTKMSSGRVLEEARYYCELHAALTPLRGYESPPPATSLLIRTLEDRLRQTLERLFRLLGLRYPPRQIHAAYLAIGRRAGEDFAAAVDFLDHVLDRELKRVLLPLLDEDSVLAQHAEDLFRIEPKDVREALKSLMHSADPWLTACAIAAAAELRIRELARDVRSAGDACGYDVAEVARAAEAALA
jgi:AAA family ATP:ADP antiporter